MKNLLKEKNKYFYVSGALVLVFILAIGNWSVYSYLISGLWFGFWAGVNITIENLEK